MHLIKDNIYIYHNLKSATLIKKHNKMGKKRIEKITRIINDNQRKVTLCKRKKGLLKKAIELSVLCDLRIFLMIQDDSNQRTTHFLSHKEIDVIHMFNQLS